MISVSNSARLVQIFQTMIHSYVAGFDNHYSTAIKNVPDIINPPDIVTFADSGFDINMNNMKTNVPCIITFDGSTYAAWKDVSKSLVMIELG